MPMGQGGEQTPMNEDSYFDAAAGGWVDGDGERINERPEDDPLDDQPEPDAWDEALDPEDDPAFLAAQGGQRELSGRVHNHGRRRGNHPTGKDGRGLRGLREGARSGKRSRTVLMGDLPPVKAPTRPTGRQLGGPAPGVGRPSYEDAAEVVWVYLGERRREILRKALRKRGANAEEREARVYLGVLLDYLDSTAANRAAAAILLNSKDVNALRVVRATRRKLRRREYPSRLVAKAQDDLRAAVGQRGVRTS